MHHFVEWMLLGVFYVATCAIFLRPIAEEMSKTGVSLWMMLAMLGVLAIVPAGLERLDLGAFTFRFPSFVGRFPPVAQLFLRHEGRKRVAWLTSALVVVAMLLFPGQVFLKWLLVSQLNVHRGLFQMQAWRNNITLVEPQTGAISLLTAFTLCHVAFYAIALLLFLPVWFFQNGNLTDLLTLVSIGLGSVAASASTAMEGDAGRPWLVNIFALTAGVLGGFLCWLSPLFLIGAYFFHAKMKQLAWNRLRSVEGFYEDNLIP